MKYPLIQRWLLDNTSLEPSLLEGAGFDSLIAGRMLTSGTRDEAGYLDVLGRSSEEAEFLASSIAVPETWFFRYPQSYRHLADSLHARLGRLAPAPALTIASIGCASGEEPYSIAMTALHAGWPAASIRIQAFDRSRTALKRAEVGEYGPASIRTELPSYAPSFLQHSGGVVRVEPALRPLIRFIHADASAPGALPGEPSYDVIFCRNLMIYLSEPARVRLLDSLTRALMPGGLLFVGHAEPLLCVRAGLRSVPVEQAFCLEGATSTVTASPRPTVRGPSKPLPPAPRSISSQRQAPPTLARAAPVAIALEPDLTSARELADAGRMQECESTLRSLIARQGPTADALELLGMVRMAANDPVSARTHFEQAVYLDPHRTAAILQLAMIHERAGDLRRAETYWRRARRLTEELGP